MNSISYGRLLIVMVRARAAQARREGRSDLGASALEWAIISAIVAGLALAVALKIKDVVDGRTKEISGG